MTKFSVRVVENITKEYPEMIKVVIFKEPKYYVKQEAVVKRAKEIVPDYYIPEVSSLWRTKQLIKDIVACNNFEVFATFTFNPARVDSFNFHSCWRVMSVWLHHQRDKARDCGVEFKYLIVPEQHKSGRWHFHALISGLSCAVRRSKCFSDTGRLIYNITGFRSGFTTLCYIDSSEAVAEYVSKYITKDFIQKYNQRRFFASKNLVRPKRSVNSNIFRNTLPIFRKHLSSSLDSDHYVLYPGEACPPSY